MYVSVLGLSPNSHSVALQTRIGESQVLYKRSRLATPVPEILCFECVSHNLPDLAF